jgi:hypothetical protein
MEESARAYVRRSRVEVGAVLKLNELRQNPVTVTTKSESDEAITMVAHRRRDGRVRLDCSCADARKGWCKHQIDLICDRMPIAHDDTRYAVGDIVLGTPLEDAAESLDHALECFAESYREMMQKCPARIDSGMLDEFGDVASQAGNDARDLARAIDTFVARLKG